jgi:hypothetical protein
MKSSLLALLLLVSLSVFAGSPAPAPGEAVILQRNLAIKAAGKINSVYWSVQRSVCMVQLDLPLFPKGEPTPEPPSIQVWLLKSDGTAIAKINKPHVAATEKDAWERPTIDYLFPPTAAEDAVAVVVQVDGEFLVESLTAEPERVESGGGDQPRVGPRFRGAVGE